MSQIISFPNITTESAVVNPVFEQHINPFQNRRVPWSGIGVPLIKRDSSGNIIEQPSCIEEAIAMCGLNWELGLGDIYDSAGAVIPHYKAITRVDNGKVFGITKDKYKPIQNIDAFGFADILLEQGATFECGGSYKGGERIWFLMRLPSRVYCGDEHDLFMFLMNGNNGKQALCAAYTTIRVACQNMAHLVRKENTYKISLQHRGDVEGKMLEAQEVMAGAKQYFDGLVHTMEELRNIKMSRTDVNRIVDGLFPYKDNASERVKNTAVEKRHQILNIFYNAPDLQNESINGYRLISAITDFESHTEPTRRTANFEENRLMNLVTNTMMADKVTQMLIAS